MEVKKKKISRSRNGCHNCKRLKIKCDESKPSCSYCLKTLNKCDYSLKLTWGGRPYKDSTKRSKQHTTITTNTTTKSNANTTSNTTTATTTPVLPPSNPESVVQFIVENLDTPPTSHVHDFEESDTKRQKIDPLEPLEPHDVQPIPEFSSTTSDYMTSPIDIPKNMATFFNAIDKFVEQGVYIPPSILDEANIHSHHDEDDTPEITTDIVKQGNFLANYEEDIARSELYLSPELPGHMFGNYQPIRSIVSPTQPENPNDLLYSIPPQISPLPTLLLEVPFYRDLLHFWVNVASNHLVPAPVNLYRDNPFKIVLTQMAMEYPSILTTLLAFSAKLRSILIGSRGQTPDFIIDQLLTRSCTEMLKILRDRKQSISNVALATSLLLCCFEAFNCQDFGKHRAHIIGARQIIKARSELKLEDAGPDTGTERDISFFLMRWFLYIDIIGSLSSARNSNKYVLVNDDVNTYEPLENVTSLNETKHDDPKRSIDHLMGFDVKFLPYLAKITLLIRKVEGIKEAVPIDIVQQALEIKESMVEILHKDEELVLETHEKILQYKSHEKSKTNTSPPEIANMIQGNMILKYTNKIFCDTGIIQLYRRVLKVPRSSKLVQELANGIGEIGKRYIEARSPADICCIFCFFTAGCETLDLEMRLFFKDRFEKLVDMGNTSAKRGLEIMERCWETNEDWISAAKELDLDITLL
ncbi:hypothetical protein JA1_003630 [Spathaspora sp. JA1]|nr:hypothetical protein JA1_003630 [Spathaspora sp. JA1]